MNLIKSSVDHYCATCKKKIPAGTPHRFDRATLARYHASEDCQPDAIDSAVAEAGKRVKDVDVYHAAA